MKIVIFLIIYTFCTVSSACLRTHNIVKVEKVIVHTVGKHAVHAVVVLPRAITHGVVAGCVDLGVKNLCCTVLVAHVFVRHRRHKVLVVRHVESVVHNAIEGRSVVAVARARLPVGNGRDVAVSL